ncbi:hypothetical protein CC86DRAFT_67083 [Ophiobolus disseminans]|uniref:Uncharacterized protein n=1 Tax=Ophiobolus disseminans TaxID=1469910 RepID=A0A6A6ZSY6_9PLEO|nr:hypothetical protein CC86DRAFT_67083 [Ophiobolus disseminans]
MIITDSAIRGSRFHTFHMPVLSTPRSLGMLLNGPTEPQIALFGVQRPLACDLVSEMCLPSLAANVRGREGRLTFAALRLNRVDVTSERAEASAHLDRRQCHGLSQAEAGIQVLRDAFSDAFTSGRTLWFKNGITRGDGRTWRRCVCRSPRLSRSKVRRWPALTTTARGTMTS